MILETGKFYHLYNRSNNKEIVFKEPGNHEFFLEKYSKLISPYVETIAYCLMPTHFHFCIRVVTEDMDRLRDNIGVLLSSYTKAINKRFDRHGSLFQQHTKAIWIDDVSYLSTVCRYIHLNPVRAGMVGRPEDWRFSSFNRMSRSDDVRLLIPLFHLTGEVIGPEQLDDVGSPENDGQKRYWIEDRRIGAHQREPVQILSAAGS
ncbi:MAG: transposase [Bacteroidetes bacterium]|nr:transposase [Bacteroidota bacterium]